MNTPETAFTRAYVEQAVAYLVRAHTAALAAVSGEMKQEEKQLGNHVKGESGRWEILYYKHDYDPTLYVLSKVCLAHEALLLATAAYDEPSPASTTPPKLVKTRSGFAGHEGGGKIDPRYSK